MLHPSKLPPYPAVSHITNPNPTMPRPRTTMPRPHHAPHPSPLPYLAAGAALHPVRAVVLPRVLRQPQQQRAELGRAHEGCGVGRFGLTGGGQVC